LRVMRFFIRGFKTEKSPLMYEDLSKLPWSHDLNNSLINS
jgi:hypothetical protein